MVTSIGVKTTEIQVKSGIGLYHLVPILVKGQQVIAVVIGITVRHLKEPGRPTV